LLFGTPVDPRQIANVLFGAAPAQLLLQPTAAPVVGGVIIPVPGRDGQPASQEIQPEQGAYPVQTVSARLHDLVERKAEHTDLDALRTDLDTVIHQSRDLDWSHVTLSESAILPLTSTNIYDTLGVYDIPLVMHGGRMTGVYVTSGDSSYSAFALSNGAPPTEPGTTSIYEDQLYVQFAPDAAPPAMLQVYYTTSLPQVHAELDRQLADRVTHAELASVTPARVLEWTRLENYTLSNILRSPEGSPTEGALVSANVTWPDGTGGRLTMTDANAGSASFDGFRITYSTAYSVVQPPFVRGTDGNVTDVPPLALTIEDN